LQISNIQRETPPKHCAIFLLDIRAHAAAVLSKTVYGREQVMNIRVCSTIWDCNVRTLRIFVWGNFMTRICWIFWTLIILVNPASAGVYKWTDATGQVQYSDRPPAAQSANAKVMRVQGSTGPEMERVCAFIAASVPELMAGLRKSMSSGEAHAAGGKIDDKLAERGLDGANFKRLLSMLYSFPVDEQSYIADGYVYSTNDGGAIILRAKLEIKNACLAGRFGHFDTAKKSTPQPAGATSVKSGTGTGFWIDADRIATSWHVVNGASTIQVTDAKGGLHDARLFAHDDDNDVAVLQVFGAQWPTCLKVSLTEAGLGADVFTVGFPQTEILGVKPKLSTGVISSRFGLRDDPRTYQISVPVQAGNSGGPLLNRQGEVVGVVASKLNAAEVFNWTGDLPQNVNYAVKSLPLQQLIGATKSATFVTGVGAETLAPQVEMAVVLIRVQ